MTVYLYFSLIPEALIASNLPPEKFGQYYATGSSYKSKGQCLFFAVDINFRSDYFAIDEAIARCVPTADGTPKHSVYVSVYRVLEHLPLSALGKLYLATAYGHTLGLPRGELVAQKQGGLHLYQDLAPVNSLVVSNLDPTDFYASVTLSPTKFIQFPALVFVELDLGELSTDPENGQANDLPYAFIHHLREALMVLKPRTDDKPSTKDSKMVNRVHSLEFPYRMVKGGFYLGNGAEMAFYPMLTHRQLRDEYNQWWRSANI
jgi:hypothetical protein